MSFNAVVEIEVAMYVRVFIIFFWACNQVTSETGVKDRLPWHVLIYNKNYTPYKYFCGGSIVRPTAVVSSAHCFYNESLQTLNPASDYVVAAGKVYKSWNDPNDNNYTQMSDVDSINIPDYFRGLAASYTNDIAVLLLSKSLEYNHHVAPVYLEFEGTRDTLQNEKGKLASWRFNSPVIILEALRIFPFNKCFTEVPSDFQQFITRDKFCGSSIGTSRAGCRGDSGAGFVIPDNEGPDVSYYLRGVLSVAPSQPVGNNCNNISAFTHVNKQKDFLKTYLSDIPPRPVTLPWHALIYRKKTIPYKHFCSGSIVKPNVVISVAHCFYDDVKWKLHPASDYAVAVGKVYREWNNPNDSKYVQKSDVDSINIPDQYRGSAIYFTEDIAVLLLSKSFEYNQHVAPVYLDFEDTLDTLQNSMGQMLSWRFNSSIIRVEVLQIVPFSKCFTEVPSIFQQYITSDKICGSSNGTWHAGCRGDSGTGFVIPGNNGSDSRHYLLGVLSVASVELEVDSCYDISAFTHVNQQKDFLETFLVPRPDISSEITTQRPVPSDKCQLPAYPPNGRYQVHNAPNASPFQISDFWILDITCNPGFGILNGENRRFCSSGIWSPTEKMSDCVPFCKLNRHPSVEYRCRSSGSISLDTRACNNYEPPGTIAIPECVKPNYFSSDELSSILCNDDGAWSDSPRCIPACGEVTPGGVVLIRNGEYAKLGELPWHAGIYRKTSTPYKQICGGSIVRPSVVISAAHCFWNNNKPYDQKLLPASDYAVAVGKLYRPWDDPEDNKYAQKADVISINIPSRFRGVSSSYMYDIAVLLLSKLFEYKPHISPICLNFEDHFDRQQITKGVIAKVAGWGVTSPNGKASPFLKVVDLPIVPYSECYDATPFSFKRFITGDKICAGYKNNGTAVCEGDSGGGLVVGANDRGIIRYYLRGIVSAGPDEVNHCTANEIITFTHVLYHGAFIKIYL